MSISRKNWSALSSLARQWTMEDEEEVEREKRRRVKSSTSTADPDDDVTPARIDPSTTDTTSGTDKSSNASQGLSSEEQMQLDFVEMLRVRDEKRRMRHVETLRRQREVDEGESEASGGGGGVRVELLGDMDEEQDGVFKPQPALKKASYSTTISSSTNSRSSITSRQRENGELSGKDPDPKPPSRPARKFVSSVSISLDRSPSVSGPSTPMSPRSPTGPLSPRELWPSPCQSPSPHGAQSPVQNGHTQETNVNGSSINGNFEQTSKPAFIRQSSRTVSFRMMRKKEEEISPLQRSSSVRMASKKFEPDTDQTEDKDKTSPFQRNSRQRTSARSIQEKMDRLAQAAQKSELPRSPDVTQRTLFLMDEVSRKRGLFEKEQPIQSPTSPGVSGKESRSFTSGITGRINRWVNKSNQSGPSHCPTDLRHVDISSKKSLFENRGEDNVSKFSPGKIYK